MPQLFFGLLSMPSLSPTIATSHRALRGFSVRRTPRACHGACAHLRPGRLRASHAVCLASRTLAPVFCARRRGADIECLSTTGHLLAESLVMRGDFFETQAVSSGFYATSRRCSPRLSPQNSNRNAITANNGAAENRSGRLRSVTACASTSDASADSGRFSCAPPLGTGCASPPPPSAVSELESLAVASELRPADLPKDIPIDTPTLTRIVTSSAGSVGELLVTVHPASPGWLPCVARHHGSHACHPSPAIFSARARRRARIASDSTPAASDSMPVASESVSAASASVSAAYESVSAANGIKLSGFWDSLAWPVSMGWHKHF